MIIIQHVFESMTDEQLEFSLAALYDSAVREALEEVVEKRSEEESL